MKKLWLLFVIFIGITLGIAKTGVTVSYYQNDARSQANLLDAATLDIGASSTGFAPSEIGQGESAQESVIVSNMGGMPFQYAMQAGNFSGNVAMCGELILDATLDGKFAYSGSLMSFSSLATTSKYNWDFTVTLPSQSNASGSACNFDFQLKAWQIDALNFDASGYHDEATVSNTVTSKVIASPLPKGFFKKNQESGTSTPDEIIDVESQENPNEDSAADDENDWGDSQKNKDDTHGQNAHEPTQNKENLE